MIEVTVPWEDSVDEAYKRKHLRYSELAAEAQHHGWNTEACLVEVGYRGFVATSTTKPLRDLGISQLWLIPLWSKHKYMGEYP